MNDTFSQPQPNYLSNDDADQVNVKSPFIGAMPHPNLTPDPSSPTVPNSSVNQPTGSMIFNTSGSMPSSTPTQPTPPSEPSFHPNPSPSSVTQDVAQSSSVIPDVSEIADVGVVNTASPAPTLPNSPVGNSSLGGSPALSQSPSASNPPVQSPMHSWAGPQLATSQFPQNSFGSPVTSVNPITTPKTLDDLVPTSAPIPDDVAPIVPSQVKAEPVIEHLVSDIDKNTQQANAEKSEDVAQPLSSVSDSSDLPNKDDSTYSSPTLPPTSIPDDSLNQTSQTQQDSQDTATSDPVEGEVIPPAPAKGVHLSAELSAIVEKYQVNQGKPHFPLNTLRLVYLIFAESIVSDNQDLVKRRADDILKIIPKVQELFDMRSSHRAENTDATLETEWQAVQEKLNEIYQIVDTPLIRQSAEFLFSYVFPLQDTLLLSLYEDIAGEKKFGVQDIYSIFHIRSMDSIFYSSLVGGIVSRDVDPSQLPANFQLAINYKLNALYQLNDLVDSIVYAKEDMENKNFSPFELVRKVAEDGTKARELITSMAAAFEKRIASFPLSDKTEKLINDFGHQLVGVIGS